MGVLTPVVLPSAATLSRQEVPILAAIDRALALEAWPEAEELLRTVVAAGPANLGRRLQLSHVLIAQGKTVDAVAHLQEAEALLARHPTGAGKLREQFEDQRALLLLERDIRDAAATRKACPYRSLPDHAQWSKSVAERPARDIVAQHEPRFRIDRATRIASAGSCFAQNIAAWLTANEFAYLVTERGPESVPLSDRRAQGFGVYSARYGNVYTALQLVQLFDRAFGAFVPSEQAWTHGAGLVDPFRPRVHGVPFPGLLPLLVDRAHHLAAVRTMFETCEVFIFTLGLTEAWRSRADGAVFPTCPGCGPGAYDPERYEFVNFGVDEVTDHLEGFVSRLRGVNPGAKIILTVSPVPMVATMEDRPVLQSTTYSKAVLRVAAQRLRDRHPHVEYFASYEIVTHPFHDAPAFAGDRRTVTAPTIDQVMRVFRALFTTVTAEPALAEESRLRPALLDTDEPGNFTAALPGWTPSMCDEFAAYAMQQSDDEVLTARPWEFYCGDTSYVFCPPELRDAAGNIPEDLRPPASHRMEVFTSIGAWLDIVRDRAHSGVVIALGSSHTARTVSWPFLLHRLERRDGRDGAVLNLGAFGSVAAYDRKILAAIARELRVRGVPVRRAVHLAGHTDVHTRLLYLARFATGERETFAETYDIGGAGRVPPRPDPRTSLRASADRDLLPTFQHAPAWETLLTQIVVDAFEGLHAEARAQEIPFTVALQPIATERLFPAHARAVRTVFAASKETDFVAWRRRNRVALHAGESVAILNRPGGTPNPFGFDFDGIYLGLTEHFRTQARDEYLDLSASFDGWQQDCWFYQSDASHYAPYGAAIVAEEIRRTLIS